MTTTIVVWYWRPNWEKLIMKALASQCMPVTYWQAPDDVLRQPCLCCDIITNCWAQPRATNDRLNLTCLGLDMCSCDSSPVMTHDPNQAQALYMEKCVGSELHRGWLCLNSHYLCLGLPHWLWEVGMTFRAALQMVTSPPYPVIFYVPDLLLVMWLWKPHSMPCYPACGEAQPINLQTFPIPHSIILMTGHTFEGVRLSTSIIPDGLRNKHDRGGGSICGNWWLRDLPFNLWWWQTIGKLFLLMMIWPPFIILLFDINCVYIPFCVHWIVACDDIDYYVVMVMNLWRVCLLLLFSNSMCRIPIVHLLKSTIILDPLLKPWAKLKHVYVMRLIRLTGNDW